MCSPQSARIIGLCVIVGVAAVISGALQTFFAPTPLAFMERDPSLSFPYRESTVPTWAVILIAFAAPGLIILASTLGLTPQRITSCLHGVSHGSAAPDATSGALGRVLPRSGGEVRWTQLGRGAAMASFGGFLMASAATVAMTNILKHMNSKARPSFFAICEYKGFREASESGNWTAYLAQTVPNTYGDISGCTAPAAEITDAQASFPSGHASISFLGLTLLSLWLATMVALATGVEAWPWVLSHSLLRPWWASASDGHDLTTLLRSHDGEHTPGLTLPLVKNDSDSTPPQATALEAAEGTGFNSALPPPTDGSAAPGATAPRSDSGVSEVELGSTGRDAAFLMPTRTPSADSGGMAALGPVPAAPLRPAPTHAARQRAWAAASARADLAAALAHTRDNFSPRAAVGQFCASVAVAAPLLLAGWIAATRVHDYKHHVYDILAGALLGFGVAMQAWGWIITTPGFVHWAAAWHGSRAVVHRSQGVALSPSAGHVGGFVPTTKAA